MKRPCCRKTDGGAAAAADPGSRNAPAGTLHGIAAPENPLKQEE